VPGPLSAMIIVTYTSPTPPTPPSSDTTGGSSTVSGGTAGNSPSTTNTSGPVVKGEPLIFKTTFDHEGHYVGAASDWQLDLEGGSAPYAISVDWGDGQHSLISRPQAGTFDVEHVYQKPGGYRGSYVTKFSASDANGSQTFLQLLAIVNNPPSKAAASGSKSGTSSSGFSIQNLIPGLGTSTSGKGGVTGATRTYVLALFKYIWPSYLFAVLLLVSFWLGERREYQYLKPRLKKRHHKARHA
jgi:hypothetical protein